MSTRARASFETILHSSVLIYATRVQSETTEVGRSSSSNERRASEARRAMGERGEARGGGRVISSALQQWLTVVSSWLLALLSHSSSPFSLSP